MNFEGAVLVKNEKLREFLTVWDETQSQYDKALEKADSWAKEEFSKLNRLQKWWYSYKGGSYQELLTMYRFKGNHSGMFTSLCSVLILLDFLPSKRRWIKLFWSNHHTEQIRNLEKCGEPVYLSSEQANLVNWFLEMKEFDDEARNTH